MPRNNKPKDEKKLNAVEKQKEATAERRKQVASLLLDRVPVDEIAAITGVHPQTIYKDKRYLERIWQRLLAEDYTVLRYREVLAIDKMEQEAIRRYEASDVTNLPLDELKEKIGPMLLAAQVSDNGKWFDRRIKLMEMRCKILGLFPRAEQLNFNQLIQEGDDNRQQIVQVYVTPPPAEGTQHDERTNRSVPYDEWITGILNPPADSEDSDYIPYENGSSNGKEQ